MINCDKISFVIPVYNNAASIEEIVNLTQTAIAEKQCKAEIIFVNDGSTDNSWEQISLLSEKHKDSVTGIDLMKNFGQHHATLCGIRHATGQFIITLDDDLAYSPAQGLELIEFMTESKLDLAYGISNKKQFEISRNLGKCLLLIGTSIGIKQIVGSSFRAISANVAKNISHNGDVVFIDDLLTSITDKYNYKKFDNFRINKKSRYNNASLYKMGLNIAFFYSGFPLKLLSYIGIIGSVISGIAGLFFLYKKLFFKVPLGYTSLIVAILFSASAILFGIGVLGKYLYRIHNNKNNVAPYHVRKTTKDA